MEDDYAVKREPNPLETAGLFSRITFMYTVPILLKGRKKQFTEDDIFKTLSRDKAQYLGDEAEKLWSEELKRCKESDKVPKLRNVLIGMQKFRLFKMVIWHIINEVVCRISQVTFLSYLISYYLEDIKSDKEIPYLYVGGFLLSSLCIILLLQKTLMRGLHTGIDMRITACCLIYRKTLRLNQSTIGETTSGHITNLLTNDASVFERGINQCGAILICPVQLIVFTIFLYLEVGPSSLIGISVFIIVIPLYGYLGKLAAKYRLKTAVQTDSRIWLMAEIIRGIEVIKMYAWEKSFAKLVAYHRKMEIKSLTKSSYIKGSFMNYFLYIALSLFITILSHLLFGNTIDARKIFFATTLFNSLAFNMGTFFSQGLALLNDINVCADRIGKFLLLDEVVKDKRFSENIELKNVTAKWSRTKENTLSDINVRIEQGSLVAVVGAVGSGKSSLLLSLLSEIPITSGDALLNGTVSYSSQDPWIFNSSIRRNILFGNKINVERYKEVINVCDLAKDLKMFSSGDRTMVGEYGSVLSGGQKARVNLARALYQDADIYLLDDPLSAVDVNVGKKIFRDCVRGFLKNKTVILVTHQLQYLQQVDRILVLESGKIKADGTFEELQKSNLNFVQLLHREDADDNDDSKDNSSIELTKQIPARVREHSSKSVSSISGYIKYASASGSKILVSAVIFLFIIVQFLFSGSFYLMTYWVNYEQALAYNSSYYITDDDVIKSQNHFVIIYSSVTAALLVTTLLRNTLLFNFCMKSSINLHKSMFESMVRASMTFFNNNGPGRILNRFTKDMGVVDELLPLALAITAQTLFSIIGIFVMTSIINFWMVIPNIVALIIFNYINIFYLSSTINIRRLENITKSPVLDHLHVTLQGITTIRACGIQDVLNEEYNKKQDINSSASFLVLCISKALSFWMDIISFIYLTIVTFTLVTARGEIYGGNVGLGITQAIQFLVQFQWGVRQLTDLENYMISVERVLNYNSIEHERDLTNKNKPPKSWPESGAIIFENVSLSYSADSLVLKNLNFIIRSEEKVGIVGRTGAGKSSIISAIFQMFEIEGKIIIDGVNIKEIGLHDLRKKISIIPQNPVIFAGSIRKNLDPFDECSDEVLWKALEDVKMKDAVKALNLDLQMEISEGGANLSVGQRQLICLARAIIRNNKILIMDEATANVDSETDVVIQETIRKKFSKCTVLTVAHRLQTVIDSDRILVLDDGEIVEFDDPHVLLQNPNSVFYNMMKQFNKNLK